MFLLAAAAGTAGALYFAKHKLHVEKKIHHLEPVKDRNTMLPAPKGQTWCIESDGELMHGQSQSGIASEAPECVMAIFDKARQRFPNATALVYDIDGECKTWTWEEYYQDTIKAAKSFIKLGLEPYESVNIIGFNSPEWFLANMGAIAAGGKAAGIYTTNGPDACKYISTHSEGKVVVCENAAQLQKFLEIRDELPKLKALVLWKGEVPEGANQEGKAPVYTWAEFMCIGKDVEDSVVNERIKNQKPGHCCTLIYTSGTTGAPKAVMISHDNATWTAKATLSILPHLGEFEEHWISYLPLSHIAAQMLDLHAPIVGTATQAHPYVIHFARPDALKGTLGDTLRKVRPTLFFGVPRVWEKINEKMAALGRNGSAVQKKIAAFAKGQGLAYYHANMVGSEAQMPTFFKVAKKVVFDTVRVKLGLDRCRLCISGAAPITSETLEYFGSLHIPIHQVYGMSECTGPSTLALDGKNRHGCAGYPLPGVEIKIEHLKGRDKEGEGEICYRGRHVMMGYMKNADKTQESIDADGFLHSGDVGRVDEYGLLYITGRIKEIIITAGGENIAPVPIESFVKKELPGISNAMMVGDKRKYNVILITLKTKPETTELDGDALTVNPKCKTVAECQQDETWKEYITAGIKAYNKSATSRAQCIQKFSILPTEFTVADGDLTPTLKLKRSIVMQKYASVIDELYK